MTKRFYCTVFFLFIAVYSFAQNNQLWKGYYSYRETTAVEQDGQNIYMATDNAVFVYNQHSSETDIYNSINGFKIEGITAMAYAQDYKKLVVGSSNGKIALIDLSTDKIYHLNDIYNQTNIPENQKKINRIIIYAGYAYLATGYGITAIRLYDNHFGDTFYIGVDGEMTNVKSVAVFNNQLYAAVENEGLKKASMGGGLIDYNNWQIIDFSDWTDIVSFENQLVGVKEDLSLNTISSSGQITQVSEVWGGFLRMNISGDVLIEVTHEAVRLRSPQLSVFDEFIFSIPENGGVNEAVFSNGSFYIASRVQGGIKIPRDDRANIQNISPSGPLSNNVFSLTVHNKDLWVAFGGYGSGMNPYLPNGLTSYGLSIMNGLQSWNEISFEELHQLRSTVNVSFNPQVPNTAYVSSFRDGLGMLDVNSKNFTVYNHENTDVLKSIERDGVVLNDVRINGVTFDQNGTGWMTNSEVYPFIVSVDKNNQFRSYPLSLGSVKDHYLIPVIDRNNTKWVGSYLNGLFAFNETQNNRAMQIRTNNNLPSNTIRSLAVDYNNQLWIGTARGLRIVSNVDQFLNSSQLTPTNIVIEDDGRAQELFFEQDILAITVDGSNNKWVSVGGSGVFLISPNGSETIFRFTTENSPLPSNEVLNISIDGTSGEVFFGTRQGIVSFRNYATTPSTHLDDIKVYPNPVKPEFTGEVKVSGLVGGANVKITDIAGNLVYETTSLGGTVTWNTFSFSGSKVPSGVYMVFVSSRDGTLSGVKKLMIIR